MEPQHTGSAYPDCKIKGAVYVGIYQKLISIARQRTWMKLNAHPTPLIRLDTRESSVVTGATNAAVHKSGGYGRRSIKAAYVIYL